MDLQQYLQALRKFWWIIVAGMVLGGIFGAISVSRAESQHRASITFFVVTNSAGDTSASAQVQGDQFAQRRVNSYVALLSTEELAERVAASAGEALEVEVDPGAVRSMISASGDLDTVLLTATVTSDTPEIAGAVGDALAVEFVDLVEDIEGGGDGPSAVRLEVVSGPSVAELPPRRMLGLAVPVFWGVLLGLGAALLLELRDNTVQTDEQLATLTSVSVLGNIPDDRRVLTSPLLVDVDGMSKFAEAFRQLRTNLQFLDIESPVRVVVITSSTAEEGKSITTANLAVSLAVAGYRTLVIEADLRRPRVAEHFSIDRTVGLTDVLLAESALDDAIATWHDERLSVLPSGPLPPNPAELLGSESMRMLVDDLRGRFDVIIIDTPPLLPVTDAAVTAAHADGVLLAVRSGRATRTQVARSTQSLRSVGAPILGTIMTMVPVGRDARYLDYGGRSDVDRVQSGSGRSSLIRGVSTLRTGPNVEEPPLPQDGPTTAEARRVPPTEAGTVPSAPQQGQPDEDRPAYESMWDD